MDPIVEAFKILSDSTLKNDVALFELIQALIVRIDKLDNQVNMLMDLHLLEEVKSREN